MNYWISLFTIKTWNGFVAAGANVCGFNDKRAGVVSRIQVGDVLLCYLTGVKRFVAAMKVASEPFIGSEKIWSEGEFPRRVKVTSIYRLEPDTAVQIDDVLKELSFFDPDKPYSLAWTAYVRGSPSHWKPSDGERIMEALEAAVAHPKVRTIASGKIREKLTVFEDSEGPVTVPETDSAATPTTGGSESIEAGSVANKEEKEESEHTRIQYLLLKLGSAMGYSVWVARNDVSREYKGRKLSVHFKLRQQLPLQFDQATLKTVELIDVLWLQDNSIVAAFEVESTTSIYSGLLRMSDLLMMQPSLSIPLYIVAPDERRNKVVSEINRPTFARRQKPLVDICRYVSFDVLDSKLSDAEPYLPHLKVSFLESLAEDCHPADSG